MKLWKSMSLKVWVYLLLTTIVPILIMFFFTLQKNTSFYNNQVTMESINEVNQTKISVENNLERVESLLNSLIFSQYDGESGILSICEQESKKKDITTYDRLQNYRKYSYITNNLIANSEYVDAVYLFNTSGYTYSYNKTYEFGLEIDYKNTDWYKNLEKSETYQVIEMYHTISMKVPEKRVVVARRFINQTGDVTGVIAVVCNDNLFKNIANNRSWNQSYIADGKGNIIYGNKMLKQLEQKQLKDLVSSKKGILMDNDGKQVFLYSKPMMNRWYVINEISMEPYRELHKSNTLSLIGILVLSVLLITVVSYITLVSIIRPIVKLSGIMARTSIDQNEFRSRYLKREDEVGILYRCYQRMMQEMNRLIEDKYISEIEFLKLKMQSLMSQINSHFIFNTLENINCLAELEENKNIAVMSKSLGDMLHYSIEYDYDEETLQAEIDHIRKYIAIQEIRFDNKIQLEIEVEEELLEYRVLKFMLQPIIENSIEHGFIDVEAPWVIRLKAQKMEDTLVITIEDNGIGLSQEKLAQLRNYLYHSEEIVKDKRDKSVGISNIHKRIQLLYSHAFGLEVHQSKPHGVKVMICLPAKS